MRRVVIIAVLNIFYIVSNAQVLRPVKWSYAAKKMTPGQAIIMVKAGIDSGWHIYSTMQADGGPVKTSFMFKPSKEYKVSGKIIEPKPVTKFEEVFNMNVLYFERAVVFQQNIKLSTPKSTVTGSLRFMVCNDKQCLPPQDIQFRIPIE